MAEPNKIQIASYILSGFSLIAILEFDLLSALLSGLLVYHLVEFGAAGLGRIGVLKEFGRIILLVIIVSLVVVLFSFGIVSLVSYLMAGPESLSVLLHKIADVVSTTRSYMPEWVSQYLPTNVEDWQVAVSGWLRENAKHINVVGKGVGLLLTHIIVGMIIGGLVAISTTSKRRLRPLSEALAERVSRIAGAFRRIVFSQVRISALNTFLTAIFLLGLLPALDSPLPLAKTLVAVTFVVGLLPIVGNLISNTVIVLVALSVSPLAAAGSLVFLILIHKLEYFVNARIIGGQIHSRAWELLVAMIVMDAAFGLPGLIAAPIYYAYLKDELSAKGLV